MNACERRRRRMYVPDLSSDLVKRLIAEGKQVLSLEQLAREVRKHDQS